MLCEKASFVSFHKIIKLLIIKISLLAYVARKTRYRYTRNITDNTHKHHRNKVVKVIVKE